MLWALLFACSEPELPPPVATVPVEKTNPADPCSLVGPEEGPPVVLLVSMDTARADGFSVYGTDVADTPVVDALASCGTRFDWALSHVPTTLNSHTSMLSGLDPHGHGVVRNGYELSPDLPLLQERMQQAGWETIAVVGSMALESKMGLSRGFDLYDQEFRLGPGLPYEDRADGVTLRTLAAVDQRQDPSRPLFLFVHYYDPHLPWDSAPPEVRSRFADPDYQGPISWKRDDMAALQQVFHQGGLSEVDLHQARQLYHAELSWTDHQLGVLLEGLDARGLGTNRLTVVTSDHGETIGDWPAESFTLSDGKPYHKVPIGHGDDVSTVNLRVPLVWMGRGSMAVASGEVVEDVVGLMDLAPTILEKAGLDASLGEGRSLVGYWSGSPPSAAAHFAEATKPSRVAHEDAWNNIDFDRRVTSEGTVYRDIPWIPRGPLVSDLEGAPIQISEASRHSLAGMLADWDAKAPPWRAKEMSDETESALEALGYVED
jgi:arylsulfatase A-like enzyme